MIRRRSLIAAAVAAGAGLFLIRDRLPWPALKPQFANGRDTPWQTLPPGGVIEIDATVNGAPVRAVVDSGAQFTAIDRAFAERLGLPRTLAAPFLAYGVNGGPMLTHTVEMDLAIPGLTAHGLRAAALDLAAVAMVTGREFRLLIGRDVLDHLVVEADFPRRRARFVARDAYRPALDARTIPITRTGRGPMAAVSVEGRAPVDVLVDTGASSVLALSEDTAQAAGLLAPGRVVSEAHTVSVGGLALNRRVRVRRIDVGPVALGETDVQIFTPAPGAPAPAGLLGSGLFARYRMALDLAGQRLWLVPPGLMIIR